MVYLINPMNYKFNAVFYKIAKGSVFGVSKVKSNGHDIYADQFHNYSLRIFLTKRYSYEISTKTSKA